MVMTEHIQDHGARCGLAPPAPWLSSACCLEQSCALWPWHRTVAFTWGRRWQEESSSRRESQPGKRCYRQLRRWEVQKCKQNSPFGLE